MFSGDQKVTLGRKGLILEIQDSNNVNEVIRAVLNSLFFFYEKILNAPKAPKAPKSQGRNQTKAQNTTSEQ